MTTPDADEQNVILRIYSTVNGVKTYHYTALNDDGIVAGFVRRIRESDGTTIEDRPMTFDDVAGHSPASRRLGH